MSSLPLARAARAVAFFSTLSLVSLGACSDSTSPATAAAIAATSGNNQSIAVGTASNALIATVTTQSGAAFAGATVTWAIVTGDGTLSSASSVTDASGTATVTYTAGTAAEAVSITATVSGLTAATFSLTQVAGPASAIAIVSGDGQSAGPGATLALPLEVKVVDADGNPVAGAVVSWALSGDGVLSATSTTTDVNGVAQVTLTYSSDVETRSVVATLAGVGTVSFTESMP